MIKSTFIRLASALLIAAASVMSVSSSQSSGGGVRNGAPAAPRGGHSATLLPNGNWLVIGDAGSSGSNGSIAVVDPVSGQMHRLATHLIQGRRGHTATVMPDGSVLIIGGMDDHDALVGAVERLDVAVERIQVLPDVRVTARANHTATLLTDGRLLLTGGISGDGRPVGDAELLDSASGITETVAGLLAVPRSGHQGTLLPDGRVAITGGIDANSQLVRQPEIFDVDTQRFLGAPLPSADSVEFAGSIPAAGSTTVGPDSLIALRFSGPLQVSSVNVATIALSGPSGLASVRPVAAENGRLVFARPVFSLIAGATYTLQTHGLTSADGRDVDDTTVTFTVRSDTPSVTTADDARSYGGVNSPWRSLKPLQAPPGVTAVAGQVLKLNGAPLADVTLRIGDKRTRTDRTGRFLLAPLPSGHRPLIIDGRSASTTGVQYGVFEVGIDVQSGRTNALTFTSWMPRIDTLHAVKIPSPTTEDIVVTTPEIPNLEVHIPAGTVIRDIDGALTHEVSITPIPLDQPPFPLPKNVYVPIYFTVQPGGGYLYGANGLPSKGARLFYPNYKQEVAGKPFDFWRYDPDEQGWYVYGQGRVAADRRQIIPEPGVRVYEFTGAMVADPGFAPAEGPQPCNECTAGDPVDLGTGLFVMTKTDLALPDLIPIAITRTYRTRDFQSRAFGVGSSVPYDMFIVGDRFPYTYADVVQADGSRIHYSRTSSGTGYVDAVYEHVGSPSRFYKSTVRWNGNGWDLKLVDGTKYVFPNSDTAGRAEEAALLKIIDRFGHTVTITRTATNVYGNVVGNISNITVAGAFEQGTGHTSRFDFTYDASNRITQVKDNIGRTVGYQYDATGHLWKVTDAAGGITEYLYDGNGRMRSIKDPRGITYLTNFYDTNSRVAQQTLADGATFQFAYTLSGGRVAQTDVTDPRGFVRRVTFNGNGYWLTDKRALGRPEEQTVTLVRDPVSNFVSSETDTLMRQTTYGYDAAGNVTSVTRLAGTANAVPTTAAYDATYNQLAGITDALTHTTAFDRTYGGFLGRITDPLGHQVTMLSNTEGQTTSVTDATGTTQLEYAGSSLVAVTDPAGATMRRTVDGAGRPILLVDALGHSTGMEYTALNQVSRITDALNGVTSFGYDGNGNLLNVTDARSGPTSYVYDAMDRVVTRTDALTHSEQYAYDLAGNRVQYTDRRGQVTNFTYDGLNRLTRVTYADGTTTAYTYDAGDRVSQLVDSSVGTTTLVWDGLDRLTSESGPKGSVSYTYDAVGRRATMTVAGQSTVTYTYDDANRLTQITQGSAVVTIGYDSADRRTLLTLPNGVSVEYGYDPAHHLTGLTYKLGQNVLGNLTYTYDANGRRASVGGSLARTRLPQPLASATYNAANQLTQWGSIGLTYDLNGNLQTKGGQTFDWSSRNQLDAVGGTAVASFQYDPFGRRTSKTIANVTTAFLYDGASAVQELAGTIPTANLLNGRAIDEVLTRTDALGTRTFLVDALGSTLALTDGGGATTTNFTYEPFGVSSMSGEATTNPAQFTGREADATGLYFYRARYYDSVTQRFASEDPLGFSAGDANLYRYVFDDPTDVSDPTGEIAPWVAACVGGAGFDVAVDIGGSVLTGRKTPSLGQLAGDAARGCASGLIGLGIGKAIGAGLRFITEIPASTPVGRLASPLRVLNGTNAPGSVMGRSYGGHAFDRMQQYGITPSIVEDAIESGVRAGARGGRISCTTDQVRVILERGGQKVVTVYPR